MGGTNLETGNRKRPGRRLGMRSCSLSILLAAICGVLPGTAAPAHASASIVVTSNSDLAADLFPGDGSCETVEGECTLRAAIEEANSDPDHDVIEFAGPMTITVRYEELPWVTSPATIDGGGVVVVERGDVVRTDIISAYFATGLQIAAPTIVRDLIVRSFFYGIDFAAGSDGSVVEGTRLEGGGVRVAAPRIRVGSKAKGNHFSESLAVLILAEGIGARIEGNSVTAGYVRVREATDVAIIGNNFEKGSLTIDRAARTLVIGNRIVGSQSHGVWVDRFSGATHIEDNVIQGNVGHGILSFSSATIEKNLVGGGPEAGNTRSGILVWGHGSRVLDNTVIGNHELGIQLRGDGAEVSRNVVAGNRQGGIALTHGDGSSVMGNLVGLAHGDTPLGNLGVGVSVTGRGHRIGGPSAPDGNVVAANAGPGIVINYVEDVSADTATVVEGNQVGSMVTGQSSGNAGDGIVVMASHTRVIQNSVSSSGGHGVKVATTGGNATRGVLVQSNVIGGSGGGNQLSGIAVVGDLATGAALLSNSIVGNGGMAIDLGANGRTENDLLDGDTGPNNRQNTPEVTSVKVMGPRVRISFRLDSTPLSTYTVELFASSACAAGEPARSLGFASIRTNEAGSAVAEVTIQASLARSEGIVATATSASGDTSEVSACRLR